MTQFTLDRRTRVSIELALAAAAGDLHRCRQGRKAAKAMGMTGAEIDALQRGSSFDFPLSAAIGLALAPDDIQRERARKAGLDAVTRAEIECMAARLAHGQDPDR